MWFNSGLILVSFYAVWSGNISWRVSQASSAKPHEQAFLKCFEHSRKQDSLGSWLLALGLGVAHFGFLLIRLPRDGAMNVGFRISQCKA